MIIRGSGLLRAAGFTDAQIRSMSNVERQAECRRINVRDKAEEANATVPEPQAAPDPDSGWCQARAGYTPAQLRSMTRAQRRKLTKLCMMKEQKEGRKPTPEQRRATAECIRQHELSCNRVPYGNARELVDAIKTLSPDGAVSTHIRVACTLRAMSSGPQKERLAALAEKALGQSYTEVLGYYGG